VPLTRKTREPSMSNPTHDRDDKKRSAPRC
jgi:hypothetical protein